MSCIKPRPGSPSWLSRASAMAGYLALLGMGPVLRAPGRWNYSTLLTHRKAASQVADAGSPSARTHQATRAQLRPRDSLHRSQPRNGSANHRCSTAAGFLILSPLSAFSGALRRSARGCDLTCRRRWCAPTSVGRTHSETTRAKGCSSESTSAWRRVPRGRWRPASRRWARELAGSASRRGRPCDA